jgi:hypothetical protein
VEKPFASVLIRIIELIGTVAKGFSFAEEDFFLPKRTFPLPKRRRLLCRKKPADTIQ